MSMGLLDRFKPQPRWKHADPGVRAAGVQDLPEEEQDLLAELARTDPDARVRRAAVSKLGSVAVLSDVVRQDADAEVRDEASGVLLDIALGAYEADESASLAAVEGLAQLPPAAAQKQLVLVAKTARREAVSRRALDRLGADQRACGTIARRADHASTRLEALGRITDDQELAATALKAEDRDVALAALERVTDEDVIRAVATRAKHPAAQRRARAIIRAAEERQAAAAEAEARRVAEAEARRKAQVEACREVEALVTSNDRARAAARLATAEERWQSLGSDADAETARRFGEAVAAVRGAMAQYEAELAEREQAARQRAAEVAARVALCERVAVLAPAEVPAALPALQAEWQQLPPLAGGPDPALDARFAAACRTAEARAREADMLDETLQRLEALLAEAEPLVADAEAFGRPEVRAHWKRLREEWGSRTEQPLPADERLEPLRARWDVLQQQVHGYQEQARQARAQQEQQVVVRAQHVAETLERLVATPEATLKTLDRALREAREIHAALEQAPPAERDPLRQRLEQGQAALGPRAQELRDAEDWQRWANASVQEQLIAKMEALRTVENPADAARQMRELQAEWKKVAAGPREQGQALWRRFKVAADEVRSRTDTWFAEQSQQRGEHLQRKLALCEKAEALADSTDWIATADAIKALQAEWKTIGPGPRKEEQAAWERFRTACDRFFTRRHEDLAQRKHAWSENLARKEALCARAEVLAESTEWETASAELKRLQSEWKTIGPVRKNKSEQIWHRFRSACDRFFERYKQRHSIDLTARLSAREDLVKEAEALAGALPADAEPVALVRALRARWAAAPPLPREATVAVTQRFETALAAIVSTAPDAVKGTEFDVAANVRRLEDLVTRAEKLAGPEPAKREAAATPASILAAQLREALAANTIGGRSDDEARWRSGEQEVRHLQAAWHDVGFVPDAQVRPLAQRFQRACQRFFDMRDQRRRALAGRS